MSGDPIDLDAIEARAEAATAGPWHGEHDEFGCVHVGDYGWVASGPQGQSPDYDGGTGDQGKADAEFIAHAREDVPALVAEVRRLRRWKDEALPVMEGLQELGGALGLPLGTRITGRQAVDAALDLRSEARRLRGEWDPNELIYGVGD